MVPIESIKCAVEVYWSLLWTVDLEVFGLNSAWVPIFYEVQSTAKSVPGPTALRSSTWVPEQLKIKAITWACKLSRCRVGGPGRVRRSRPINVRPRLSPGCHSDDAIAAKRHRRKLERTYQEVRSNANKMLYRRAYHYANEVINTDHHVWRKGPRAVPCVTWLFCACIMESSDIIYVIGVILNNQGRHWGTIYRPA